MNVNGDGNRVSENDNETMEKPALGALADELYAREEAPSEDEVFEAFAQWASEQDKELWPHQEEAILSLMMGEHVVLGTPTGSGKSLVALSLLFKACAWAAGAPTTRRP